MASSRASDGDDDISDSELAHFLVSHINCPGGASPQEASPQESVTHEETCVETENDNGAHVAAVATRVAAVAGDSSSAILEIEKPVDSATDTKEGSVLVGEGSSMTKTGSELIDKVVVATDIGIAVAVGGSSSPTNTDSGNAANDVAVENGVAVAGAGLPSPTADAAKPAESNVAHENGITASEGGSPTTTTTAGKAVVVLSGTAKELAVVGGNLSSTTAQSRKAAEVALAANSGAKNGKQIHGFIELVDTIDKCRNVCQELLESSEIAVDIEGVKLGRSGEICIVQIANKLKDVFLFDVTTLGNAAFTSGLKEVLESKTIAKLFYDCRADTDALFHLHGVTPQNILDMQILCHKAKAGDSTFLVGIAKAMGFVLPVAERQVVNDVKNKGVSLFAPDRGGTFQVWKKRPLPKVLVDYCAQDVVHLFAMRSQWANCLPQLTLRAVSEYRMRKRISSKVVESGPQLARVDFKFPDEAKTLPKQRSLKVLPAKSMPIAIKSAKASAKSPLIASVAKAAAAKALSTPNVAKQAVSRASPITGVAKATASRTATLSEVKAHSRQEIEPPAKRPRQEITL